MSPYYNKLRSGLVSGKCPGGTLLRNIDEIQHFHHAIITCIPHEKFIKMSGN